jgi:raffinose/stachyose/melibiose transport system substrate-binding protein
MERGKSGRPPRVAAVLAALVGVLLGALLPGEARSTASDSVTISLLADTNGEPGWQVLIPNFERVYPNVTVDATYAPSATVSQLETTELAGGNAPDVLSLALGCGSPNAVCTLAPAGDLAPMIAKPWTRRSLPVITSLAKHGAGLYTFEPTVAPYGMFTNDALFAKLGLKVPQTFSQLLSLCQRAGNDGTVAVLLAGGNATIMALLVYDLAAATLYGKDPGGTVSSEPGPSPSTEPPAGMRRYRSSWTCTAPAASSRASQASPRSTPSSTRGRD